MREWKIIVDSLWMNLDYLIVDANVRAGGSCIELPINYRHEGTMRLYPASIFLSSPSVFLWIIFQTYFSSLSLSSPIQNQAPLPFHHHILQHSFALLLRLDPLPLQDPRIPLCLIRNPPRNQRQNCASAHKPHCHREWNRIPRRILFPEYLRADRAANLPVRIHEPDAECRACCARRCLDTPGPSRAIVHQRN